MTTYNTGNPIGSKDPRDLYDNAENLDDAVNTRTAESWDDRFGVARKTWYGMEQDFQQFLINSGYENIGDYGPGLEITARNQIFWRDGELYRAGAVLELPYTTTGDWGDEEGLFVAVGNAALRQELGSELGSSLVGYGGGSVETALTELTSRADMQDVRWIIDPKDEATKIIAHRGFAHSYTENTKTAVTGSINSGVWGIEVDVSWSQDGVPYLFHDVSVDSTTNGTGVFTSLDSAYIDTLRYTNFNPSPIVSRILRFDEFCETIRWSNCWSVVELKTNVTENNILSLLNTVRSKGIGDRTVFMVSPSDWAPIATVLSAHGDFKAGRFSSGFSFSDTVNDLSEWPFRTMVGVDIDNIHGAEHLGDLRKYAEDKGVVPFVFTIKSLSDAHKAMGYGVRSILSDVFLEV